MTGRAQGVEWTERVLVRKGEGPEDAVRLSLRDWGVGGGEGGDGAAAVLLLHGLAGHCGEWDDLARRLRADGHRVLALDQRGHGASERRPADVSRAAYVADIDAVISELGLSGVVLIGQSYGGHAALLAAGTGAGGVAGAVLVEAGPGRDDPESFQAVADWLRGWPVPFPSREAAVAHLGGGPVGEAWADGLEPHDDGLRPRFDPEILIASLRENTTRSWWREWAAIDVPVLVVLGRHGIIGAADHAEMARLQPDRMRSVSVPDAGHDLHLEQPETLYRLVRDFLAAPTRAVAESPCAGARSNT
ncbi:alpha/beta fold hydrolase [Streptomyces sp. NPDC090025]|uniref:alpha/beta fold hydrolase n=1 Tax=Streptomyces sp. NPDC090025 TaxID=3365922 RepID=UPI003833B988